MWDNWSPEYWQVLFFNALTKSNISAENYPFCTIDPNNGLVQVPDLRLDKLDDIINPKAKVEAIMEFTDIAGLVKGCALISKRSRPRQSISFSYQTN